jgi:hypothetical protein
MKLLECLEKLFKTNEKLTMNSKMAIFIIIIVYIILKYIN